MKFTLMMKESKLEDSIKSTPIDQIANSDSLSNKLSKTRLQLIGKRAFDIVFSFILIVMLSPLLIVVSILVKLSSSGPIMYANYRVGLKGGVFKCYKFRSMTIYNLKENIDNGLALKWKESGRLYKEKNDSRVTTIGKFIRRTSIDELPQLFNVLKGDMSIVGPRPLIQFMLEPYPEFCKARSLVKPGITGLWQIRSREQNTSAEFMYKHDIEYLENFSMLLDIKILLITPWIVITGKGAY